MFISSKFRLGRGNMFLYTKKLTAGLLVFLFFATPFYQVLADEQTPPDSSAPVTEENTSPEETTPLTEDQEVPEVAPPENGDVSQAVPEDSQEELDSVSDPKLPAENNLKKKPAAPDEASGALVYDYPISIAPGRNGMQPDLELIYNSQSRDITNWLGQGWSLNIPYIERSNKQGVEKTYTDPVFISSLSDELVLVNGEYKPKVDSGEFLSYSYSNSVWTATDKQGTVYTFGAVANSRQDDPNDDSRIFKWMLQEVRDTNDNYISYEYFKNQGQIYPSKILYTHHGAPNGIFEVEFTREARPDQLVSNKTGFTVKTDYRLKEILSKVNNSWSKKYTLTYTTGDNNATSLVQSITESGKDEQNNIISLPSTSFQYQTTGSIHWQINTTTSSAIDAIGASDGMVADINGDGLDDLLKSFHSISPSGGNETIIRKAYLNDGQGGFVENSSYSPPFDFLFVSGSQTIDSGARLVDLNGDGLLDLINSSHQATAHAYLNTGGGWQANNNWLPSLFFTYWSTDVSASLANLNGDNLPDMIGSAWEWNGQTTVLVTYAYINNGDGWTRDLGWQVPLDLRATQGTSMVDVNGDGLDDILQSVRHIEENQTVIRTRTFLNTGNRSWIETTDFVAPHFFFDVDYYGNVNDLGYRLFDVNGDGLVDIMRSGVGAYINTGSGWVQNFSWNTEIELGGNWSSPSVAHIANMKGDGMPDIFKSQYLNSTTVELTTAENIEARVNLLKKITYPTGGHTDITYQATPLYRNGPNLLNPHLSLIIDTVKDITHSSGFDQAPSTISYEYEGGYFYHDPNNAYDGKLAGFSKVTATDHSSKTISYYHQGNGTNSTQGEYNDHVSKIGRKYRTEVKDLNGNLYSVSINKWDRYDFNNNGRNFVKLVQTIDSVYDGNSTHRDRAQTYIYNDTNGNQTEIKQWGEVNGTDSGTFMDIATDPSYTTTIDYASNTSNGVIGLPSNESTLDQSSVKVNQTRHYYDNLPLGQVGSGNETKTEQWRVGSKYIDVEKTYNGYGLVISEKDPRGKETSYIYDAYNLYPTTITNPLNQVTHLAYDYSSGQVTETLDPNNRPFYTDYDALDRPIAERQPDPANPSLSLAKSSYQYTNTANATSIKKTDYLDAANSIDTYTYFDGLGRKIQERKEAEAATQFSIRDFVYGLDDLLLKESLPYFGNNSARTPATTTTALYTRYTYDPMKRVVTAKVTNDDWTTTNTYDDWKTTVTDADGKTKDLYRDAYDNLVQVGEHNASSVYTTTYDWTGLKKLKKITDALGNIRNFSYDGLGRALMAEDLHAVGDTTFGIWYYAYDDASNLVSRTDPNNQIVNYGYDDLNRILSEDYTGTQDIDVTYAYDTCTEGVGRLCSVVNSSLSVANTYNALGQLVSEMKIIDALKYSTQYNYDRQGNQILIINPDGSRVQYLYNAGGAVNRIQRKEKSDSGFIDVISNIDYNSVNLPTILEYGNGAVTTNTYDDNKLYRLSHKVTTANNQGVQDLTYTYDPVGNILQIVDASNTQTAKTTDYTYDDLHRLLSATITNSAAQGIDGEGDANQVQTFTYDAIGNILTKSDVGTYLYEGNQGSSYANPHAVTSANGVTYTYDNNGNVVSAGMLTAYAWDYNNRLMSVSNGLLGSFYSYDAGGQRVKSVTPSATTIDPTQSYSISNSVPEKHIFLGDTAIATVQGTGSGAQTYDIHADHLTGSNVITDANQNIDELTDYYAFGTIRLDQQNSSHNEDRKYTGHEYDQESGLTYANARYYNASLGRWMSEDNVSLSIANGKEVEQMTRGSYILHLSDPQALNSYSYVRNNPLKYKDYDGNAAVLLLFLYIGIEIFSSGYDLFNIYKVDNNLNSSEAEKFDARAMALLGTIMPGPGSFYAKGSLKIDQIASKIQWDKIWTKGEFRTGFTNLMKHAIDHAEKLGFKNADEYLQGARSFVSEAIDKGYSATMRASDNTLRIFDQSTGRFASYELVNGKLTPKTFMKADSINYWTNQMKNYGGQVLYDLKELIK